MSYIVSYVDENGDTWNDKVKKLRDAKYLAKQLIARGINVEITKEK